jgi:hypothetical protein
VCYWCSPFDSRNLKDHHHLNRRWADKERVEQIREYLKRRDVLRELAALERDYPMQLVDPHAVPRPL